jgi:FkbM family methyltransferase
MSGAMTGAYRLTAGAIAGLVAACPPLERPLVWTGARVWAWPRAGRLYRSVAGRYAARLRANADRFRRVDVAGVSLTLDVTEFTTSTLYFGRSPYEPHTTAFLQESLRPGGVFVDVGASHGYFTLIAAALVGPNGRAFAFEPNPAVAAQLDAQVAANGFGERVVVSRDALADEPCDARELFVSQDEANSGLSTLTPDAADLASGLLSPARTVRVAVDTFDRWRERAGVAHMTLVKIDAEHAEDLVVAGMAGALAEGRIDRVVCETTGHSRAHAALCAAGFTAHVLDAAASLSNIGYVRRR